VSGNNWAATDFKLTSANLTVERRHERCYHCGPASQLSRFLSACHATECHLTELATRASRIAELLRTRVNVAIEAQKRESLESMNRRAALQLHLLQTVEGLSVVAISLYAVSLPGYLLAPLAKATEIDKSVPTALAVVPVVGLVWWLIRRMRKRVGGGD
jgi:uncharacterized membrane-anchored protein